MIKKWIKRIIAIIVMLFIIVLIGLHIASFYFRYPNKNADNNIEVVTSSYKSMEVRHFKYTNVSADYLIVFVHGAPGSAGDLVQYLSNETLREKGSIVAIDRLGYGYSNYGAVASIDEQVEFLNFVVEKESGNKKIILVGHSYGAPIVGAYASKYATDGILLLAGVIDPYNEKIFWFSYPAFWKATSWLLPAYLKVAGAEKKAHESELLKIKDIWSQLEVPVVMVHDSMDYIAPGLENINWASEQIPDSLFYFQPCNGDSHFVPFNNEELTTSMVLQLMDISKK